MSENDNEDLDSQNQTTDEVVENTEISAEEVNEAPEFTESEKKLFARTKKAESELREAKKELNELKKKPESQQNNLASSSDPVEVANLANALRGLTSSEIDFARTIAAGSNTSLLKAIQSDGFQAYHDKIVVEERKKKAALGGSKGSSQVESKSLSDLSRSEHEKLAAEMAANIQ